MMHKYTKELSRVRKTTVDLVLMESKHYSLIYLKSFFSYV